MSANGFLEFSRLESMYVKCFLETQEVADFVAEVYFFFTVRSGEGRSEVVSCI